MFQYSEEVNHNDDDNITLWFEKVKKWHTIKHFRSMETILHSISTLLCWLSEQSLITKVLEGRTFIYSMLKDSDVPPIGR